MKTNRLLQLIAIGSLTSLIACGASEPQVDPASSGKADVVDCTGVTEITFDCPADMPREKVVLPDGIPVVPLVTTDYNPPPVHSDLVEFQSPVQSQGRRGVCSIFANVGFMEHLYLKGADSYPVLADRYTQNFSEQYLQWAVKFTSSSGEVLRDGNGEIIANQRTFPQSSGSNAYYNLRAISNHGIPAEAAWKYEINEWGSSNHEECTGADDQPTFCYTNGHPSEEAMDAPRYKLPTAWRLNARGIKNHIGTKKTAVVLGLKFFYQSWNHRKTNLEPNKNYWNQGIVLMPNEADETDSSGDRRAGHGILVVGWDDNMEVPRVDKDGKHTCTATNGVSTIKVEANKKCPEGYTMDVEKGFYIFKNSWGTGNFGVDNPYGDGFGFISMDYIHRYASCQVSSVPTPDMLPEVEEPEPQGESRSFHGELEQGAYSEVMTYDIGDSAKNVKVVMTGTGDADLYVNYGDEGIDPEDLGSAPYVCRPYDGGSNETCDADLANVTSTKLVVFVHGFEKSTYEVKITWDK